MHGFTDIYIGEAQCGKTTLAKKILDRNPTRQQFILSTKRNFGKKIYHDFKQWRADASAPNVTNSIIIMDEFDSYLHPGRGRVDLQIVKILTCAQEYNNLCIFIGHSYEYLPSWIMVNSHGIRRWNTVDMNLKPFYEKYHARPQLVNSLKQRPVLNKYESVYIPLR